MPEPGPAQPRGPDPTRTITVVSGLPRSGTSLAMQMLEAAGLDVATDGVRAADADNPRGYYELAAVNGIREDSAFLEGLVGRVVKMVSPQLLHLPKGYDYRVVYMERALDEILASQRAMLARAEEPAPADEEALLARAFEGQERKVRAMLATRGDCRVCYVAHAELLREPERCARRIVAFLAEAGALPKDADPGALAAVVDPALWRNRAGG